MTRRDATREHGADPRQALVEAGHHAEAVNNHAGAARYFDQVLEITSESDDCRPSRVLHAATARFVMGVADDEMPEAALTVQVESSDWEAAAEIERLLALHGVRAGDGARVERHLAAGAEFAARIPYTRIAAVIADQRARELALAGRSEAAREILRLPARFAQIFVELRLGINIYMFRPSGARLTPFDSWWRRERAMSPKERDSVEELCDAVESVLGIASRYGIDHTDLLYRWLGLRIMLAQS